MTRESVTTIEFDFPVCSSMDHTMSRSGDFVLRYKLTVSLLIVLALFAVLSGSYWEPLPEAWRSRFGFSPRDLINFRWHRIFTCPIVTAGEWKFAASFSMLALAVGIAESRFGTLRTVVLFFGCHLIVLLVMSTVILFAEYGGVPMAGLIAVSRDVGPSAGYYGCWGAVIATLNGYRGRLFSAVGLVLILRLVASAMRLPEHPSVVSADLAHLIALPIGWMFVRHGLIAPLDPSEAVSASA
jgi:membrane associated rhomboid family serine protease